MLNLSTRESAVRRSLQQQGYSLRKTPARSKEREAFGVGYMVVDDRNTVVLGANNHPHSATIDEVEAFADAA